MSLGLPVIVGSYACIVGGCWDVFGSFPTYLTKHEWSILGRRPMQDVVSKYSNFFKHMVSDYPNGEIQNHYEQEYDIMDGRRIFPVTEQPISGADTTADAISPLILAVALATAWG
ncbi:sterigmatocystin 8-O-methyltransferase [Colletotrichum tofieldiae]|nr:sterigmatocystin 8-O-methyltransferase [Colletotrichum tofieldiae]